jgi:5-methyltetrahydrofolate--homocysteine methyltransferase
MPVGAINTAGKQVFALVRRLREELNVNTTCGASNISFGLPNRRGMNMAFLAMASGAGMTSAIMNPLHDEDMVAIRASDVLLGLDPDCRRWIRRYREPAPVSQVGAAPGAAEGAGGARGGRGERRRRRAAG